MGKITVNLPIYAIFYFYMSIMHCHNTLYQRQSQSIALHFVCRIQLIKLVEYSFLICLWDSSSIVLNRNENFFCDISKKIHMFPPICPNLIALSIRLSIPALKEIRYLYRIPFLTLHQNLYLFFDHLLSNDTIACRICSSKQKFSFLGTITWLSIFDNNKILLTGVDNLLVLYNIFSTHSY